MKQPVYGLVIGNVPGARAADDPDKEWEPGGTIARAVVSPTTNQGQKAVTTQDDQERGNKASTER